MTSKKATLYVDGVTATAVDISNMVVDGGDLVVGGDFTGNIVGVRFSPGCLEPAEFMTLCRTNGIVIYFN